MLEAVLGILAIVELFITLGVSFYIAGKSELEYKDAHNFILSALGDFLKKLFVGKNWFGISLSVIIFILIIPAILLLLFRLGE